MSPLLKARTCPRTPTAPDLNERAKSAHVSERSNEEKQGRIQQPHCEPGIASEVRS
jgi:hypothetical protein